MTTAMRQDRTFVCRVVPAILAFSALLAATPRASAQFSPFAPGVPGTPGIGSGSGMFNPYDPLNPVGGYGYGNLFGNAGGELYGYSQVLKAYGQVLTSQENARIIREQSMQAKIDTARKRFDFEMYLRANAPTYADDQALLAKNMLKRIQVASLPTEIVSGKALNILLDDIRKFPLKKANMDPLPLNEDVVSRLNVTGKNNGIGMLRNGGKLEWPTGLDFVAPETRAAIDRLTQKLVASALQGTVDRQILDELNARTEEIKTRMVRMVNDMPAGIYLDADRFLTDFQLSRMGIGEGQAPTQVKFQQFVKGGKTMQEVADYMVANGLKFAAANYTDDAAYRALHSAMIAFDIVLNTDTKTTSPEPAKTPAP